MAAVNDEAQTGALASAIQALDQLIGFIESGLSSPFGDGSIARTRRALRSALAQLGSEEAAEFASAVAGRVTQLAALSPQVPSAAEIESVAPAFPAPFWQTLMASVLVCELMNWLTGHDDVQCTAGLLAPEAALRLVACCAGAALGPGMQITAAVARHWEERDSGLPDYWNTLDPASGGTALENLLLAVSAHVRSTKTVLLLSPTDSSVQLSRALRAGLCRPQQLGTFLAAALPVLQLVQGVLGALIPEVWLDLDLILHSLRSACWGEAQPQLEDLSQDTLSGLVLLAAREHTYLYNCLPVLASGQLAGFPWVEQWPPVARVASVVWVQEQHGSGSHAVLRQLLSIAVAALRAVARRGGGQEVACSAVVCLARLTSMRLRALLRSEDVQPPARDLVECLEAAAICASSFPALASRAPAKLADELHGLFEVLQRDLHPSRAVSCLREAPGAAEALAAASEAVTRLAAEVLQQWQAAAGDRALLLLAVKVLGAAISLIMIYGQIQGEVPMGPALQQAAAHAARSTIKLVLSLAQLSAAQLEALADGSSLRLPLVSTALMSSLFVAGGFPQPGGRDFGAAAGIREDGVVEVSEATGVLWAAVVAGRALAALPPVPGAKVFAIQLAGTLARLIPWVLQQRCCFTDMIRTACNMAADAANVALEVLPPTGEEVGKMHKFLTDFQDALPEHPRVGAALVQCGFCARLVSWVQQAACGAQEGASQEELEVLSAARNVVLFAGASLCSWALKRREHRAAAEEWLRKMLRLRSTPKENLRARRVWQQSVLGEVLPQMQVWAAAAAECWRAEEAAMSDDDWLEHEGTLAWRPCVNLRCTTVRGASEARLRGRLCGGCGAVRYCCRSCQEQDWPRHRYACWLIS